MIRSNHGPVSRRFRDKQLFLLKIANFPMHFRVLDVPAKEVPVGLLLSRVSMQRRARYCFTNVCLSVCLYLRKRMDLIVTVFDDVVATSFYSFLALLPLQNSEGTPQRER